MFAKFSPDNKTVAYVSEFNVYEENFQTGEITPLTEEDAGTAERITKNLGRSLGGTFKGIGDIFASMGKKMTDTNAGLVEHYKDELDAIGVQQKKAEKEALAQAFSQTTTTDEIVLRQQKGKDSGYVEVRGVDGKMHDSFITAAVTNPLLNHPEKFTISSTNPKVKKNPAEYIRLAKQDEGWNLDIRSISGAATDSGSVDIFYDLSGPKSKKEGTIVVTLTDPYQIENVTKDLLTQGSVIGASQLTHRYLPKMAKLNEGKKEASYPIYKRNPDPETQSEKPTLQDSANVSFDANTGIYSIKIGSSEVATARSSYELGALLVDLQLIALGLDPQ